MFVMDKTKDIGNPLPLVLCLHAMHGVSLSYTSGVPPVLAWLGIAHKLVTVGFMWRLVCRGIISRAVQLASTVGIGKGKKGLPRFLLLLRPSTLSTPQRLGRTDQLRLPVSGTEFAGLLGGDMPRARLQVSADRVYYDGQRQCRLGYLPFRG